MTAPETDTESFWDRESEGYDAAHDREDAIRNPLWIRMAIVMGMLDRERQAGNILDCGMGPGRLLVELAQRGWSVAGIDVSGEMVARARNRLPASADRLVQGSIESLPFPTESFDAAVATGVLEYVDDLPRALAEVTRVLRPGGVFVIGAPNMQAARTLWRHRVAYCAVRALKGRRRFGRPVPLRRPGLLSRHDLEAQLTAAGLAVERVEYITLIPALIRRRFPFFSRRLADLLGRSRVGPLVGAQLVVAARKPGGRMLG